MDIETRGERKPHSLATRFFLAIASLKLTVTLLALAIFLLFAGTLAQVRDPLTGLTPSIWTVVRDYFRCPLAYIHVSTLLPGDWTLPEWLHDAGFYYPGGWLLGGLMIMNLLAAHSMRFTVAVRGRRRIVGLLVLALGIGSTAWAITHVFDRTAPAGTLDPSWRVTVQLLQGGGAALVLLVGCILLFRKRAGIVLLHGGLLLLMLSEFFTGMYAREAIMRISEGETVDYAVNLLDSELAVYDHSSADMDTVTLVPDSLLKVGTTISHPDLPFDIRVLQSSENPEVPGMKVAFLRGETGEDLGTHLLYAHDPNQPAQFEIRPVTVQVSVDGKPYCAELRFARIYKPYSLTLHRFRFDRYPGTSVPKDYSSTVQIVDSQRSIDREVRIWMNNPLRHRDETIYQADFDHETERGTVLQVVENAGWMIPYVSCMIVATGMLAHFMITLVRFLKRRQAA